MNEYERQHQLSQSAQLVRRAFWSGYFSEKELVERGVTNPKVAVRELRDVGYWISAISRLTSESFEVVYGFQSYEQAQQIDVEVV